MTDKRDLLLTLVFIKFIGDRFNQRREEIVEEVKAHGIDDEFMIQRQLQNPNQYQQEDFFYLSDDCLWDKLIELNASDMASKFDNCITELEQMEVGKDANGKPICPLKNALPEQIFTKTALEAGVLKKVCDEINKIDPKKFKETDLIGRVYEYFLQAFSINADKEEGEFYTPHSIVELIASLIEPYDGTIYDPACGSGGMFVQSLKMIAAHGGNTKAVSVFGQESEPATYRLCKMNLAVRDISYNLGDNDYKKTNKVQAMKFEEMLQKIIDEYNTRDNLVFTNTVAKDTVNAVSDIVDEKLNSLSEKILQLFKSLNADKEKFKELGISFEEKAFYDVLVNVRDTHGFEYDDERCIELAKKIKLLVDDVTIYADFANNNNLKSKLSIDLTYLIYKEGYPPQWDQEVFQKVLEQVENYKNHEQR